MLICGDVLAADNVVRVDLEQLGLTAACDRLWYLDAGQFRDGDDIINFLLLRTWEWHEGSGSTMVYCFLCSLRKAVVPRLVAT
jgi:hypothetical protein